MVGGMTLGRSATRLFLACSMCVKTLWAGFFGKTRVVVDSCSLCLARFLAWFQSAYRRLFYPIRVSYELDSYQKPPPCAMPKVSQREALCLLSVSHLYECSL